MSHPPDPVRSRAILIGVGHYDHDALTDIPAVHNNLDDLQQLLTSPGGALIPENCVAITDPRSGGAIGNLLVDIAEQAEDTLLIYYAGHGVLDRRGRLHLALSGTRPDQPRWSALPFDTLRETILESYAATRIVILDCCFSGRAIEAMGDTATAVLGQADIEGTYVFTSTARNQPAYAPAGQRHTAFTGALLAAAASAPGASLDELYRLTEKQSMQQGFPRPQRRSQNTASDLILFPARDADPRETSADRSFSDNRAHADFLERLKPWTSVRFSQTPTPTVISAPVSGNGTVGRPATPPPAGGREVFDRPATPPSPIINGAVGHPDDDASEHIASAKEEFFHRLDVLYFAARRPSTQLMALKSSVPEATLRGWFAEPGKKRTIPRKDDQFVLLLKYLMQRRNTTPAGQMLDARAREDWVELLRRARRA